MSAYFPDVVSNYCFACHTNCKNRELKNENVTFNAHMIHT